MATKWMGVFLILAVFAPAGAGWGAPKEPATVDEIVLVVDQDSMTRTEMQESIKEIFDVQGMKEPAPGTKDYEEAKKEVGEGFIREVLLAEEADREKIEISDEEIDRQTDQQIEEMKKRFPSDAGFEQELKKEGISQDDLHQELHDQILRTTKAKRVLQMKQHDLPGDVFVTDEEVKNYYNLHPKDYEQAKFSIILFRIPEDKKSNKAYLQEVQKQAKGVLQDLKGGANFATTAKKYSEDPASAEKGGDVGTHYRVDLDPKLADGVFALPPHGLGLVTTPEGVYIVKLESKGAMDFDTVAPDIKDHLHKQKQDNAFNLWLDGLKKDAYIVEDGKVVTFKENPEGSGTISSSTPLVTTEAKTPTPVPSANGVSSTPTEAATPSTKEAKKAIYPTLPEGGTFILELGGEGFSYGTQDLSNYYGPSVNTNQGFPFGYGFHGSLDFAVDPSIELGAKLEILRKITETVNFSPAGQSSYSDKWSAGAFGGGLEAKLLLPLDESTNFILSAEGGYYILTGGDVIETGSAVTESANFSGSNFGGEAGGAIEFFLDGNKDTTLGLQAGYRYLQFRPLNSNLLVNNGGYISNFPSPLTNADGSQALIDLSGIDVGLSVRFYIDK